MSHSSAEIPSNPRPASARVSTDSTMPLPMSTTRPMTVSVYMRCWRGVARVRKSPRAASSSASAASSARSRSSGRLPRASAWATIARLTDICSLTRASAFAASLLRARSPSETWDTVWSPMSSRPEIISRYERSTACGGSSVFSPA